MSNPANAISLNEFCSKIDTNEYLRLGKELSSEDVGKSFSLLSFGLSLNSSKQEELYNLYMKVVECWSGKLIESSRYEDVLKIFEVAHDIYPHSADLNYLLACTLHRIGKLREAWQYALNVLSICNGDPKVWDLASSLANSLVDRWHFPMINDQHRNKAFKDAIEKSIQCGHTSVLDIGAGSALLSIYASRAGAEKTYACEVNEFMTEMASNVLALNAPEKNIIFLNKHSKDLHIPSDLAERVSLVVTETFDAGLFGEHILLTLKHAWEELLLQTPKTDGKPSMKKAKVIPNHAQIWIAIIECDYIARQTKAMRKSKSLKDIDIRLQLDEPYLSEKINSVPGMYKLLTKWKNVLTIDFNSLDNINELLDGKKEDLDFLITADGRGDAIVLAYKLFLDSDRNVIDTSPDAGTCWENALFPIFTSKLLSKESWITVHMEFDEVLHFSLSDQEECPYLITTDVQLLKCFNSSSYTKFYRENAKKMYEQNPSMPLIVLDNCPFPEAGLTLLEMDPNTKLFVGCESAYHFLSQNQINVKSSEALKGQADVIFYWPFAPEGTLKQNIMQDLQLCRKTLKKSGKFFPEFLHLKMLGIESEIIAKMTRIDNTNTCGVDIAHVFDLLKTQHHLDIPIEGIEYKPVTSILHPMSFCLSNSKIVHTGKLITEDSTSTSLIVGEEVLTSSLPLHSVSEGRIDGFIYWFEMNNSKSSPESEVSSGSEYDCGSETSALDINSLKVNLENKFESLKSFESTFNSISRDSSINQCVILLNDPIIISQNLCLSFRFNTSDGHFSINI